MLALGLLISTSTKNQFVASQAALIAAFLPAFVLSGFIFEIDSMPAPIRPAHLIVPARYFVSEPADAVPRRRRGQRARARNDGPAGDRGRAHPVLAALDPDEAGCKPCGIASAR